MLRRFLGNRPKERESVTQVLRNEQESVEDAIKFVGEHPNQEVPVEVGGEKFKVVADSYGKEIKPA